MKQRHYLGTLALTCAMGTFVVVAQTVQCA